MFDAGPCMRTPGQKMNPYSSSTQTFIPLHSEIMTQTHTWLSSPCLDNSSWLLHVSYTTLCLHVVTDWSAHNFLSNSVSRKNTYYNEHSIFYYCYRSSPKHVRTCTTFWSIVLIKSQPLAVYYKQKQLQFRNTSNKMTHPGCNFCLITVFNRVFSSFKPRLISW